MTVSGTARKNHDELFPGRVSTLAVSDPELVEVFDNFAFDEVLRHTSLDTRTRLMVQLAALIGARTLSEYRVMLGAALTNGVTPVEAKEIVYQAVLYTGMGNAFDFIHATNDVLTEHGIELPLPGQSATPRPPGRSRAGPSRSRSSARTGSRACTSRRPGTNCIFSSSCRPTASATTSPAPGSVSRSAS